jgi:septal ring factor EnvC (AmiA/AmiB activator)
MGSVVAPSPKEAGLYHKVRRKETLWRISKMYGVDLERLAAANRLHDKKKIYAGQVLFIPQAGVTSFGESAKEKSFVWPLKGKMLSFYGSSKDGVKNKGIDIKARHGEAVIASRSGKVSFVDENMKGFGKTIIIDHDDNYSTVYAYNSQIFVEVGQRVRQGTIIAKAGQSGRAPSPRLHFEIRKKHEPQNPFYFLP